MKITGLKEFQEAKEEFSKNILSDLEVLTRKLIECFHEGEIESFKFKQCTLESNEKNIKKDILIIEIRTKGGQNMSLGSSEINLHKVSIIKPMKAEFANAKIEETTSELLKEIQDYLFNINKIDGVILPNLKDEHEFHKRNFNHLDNNRISLLPELLAHLAPKVDMPIFYKGIKHNKF